MIHVEINIFLTQDISLEKKVFSNSCSEKNYRRYFQKAQKGIRENKNFIKNISRFLISHDSFNFYHMQTSYENYFL